MTYLRLTLLFVLMSAVSFCLGYWTCSLQHPTPKAQLQPLSVTILDDGGAKLKVESTVVEKK